MKPVDLAVVVYRLSENWLGGVNYYRNLLAVFDGAGEAGLRLNVFTNDPAFLAEAEKRRLDIDPATGEELDSLAKEVMTATPDIIEKVKKLIGM